MSEYLLIGVDGNTFSVMGYVTKAMKREGKSEKEVTAYSEKAMSSYYNSLLSVSQDVIEELNEEIYNA